MPTSKETTQHTYNEQVKEKPHFKHLSSRKKSDNMSHLASRRIDKLTQCANSEPPKQSHEKEPRKTVTLDQIKIISRGLMMVI